ncbi:MAG TPA: ABC transporter permease [Candidatus Blautia intestinipullorum]|nr:ABC transporter permease [Candidatus Blautia intestinipullorum]
MRVKNRKTIWNLSLRSFRASGKRNVIAAAAIALTTLLFTSLFTIVMSLNSSYQTYTFRQIGGYAHGTFKDVTEEQAQDISGHRKVKAAGERIVAGTISDGVFAKVPAEISYMDSNNTKWSYIELEEGREPEAENEIIMDKAALELLDVTPEIGAEISLTYQISDKNQNGGSRTDTFVLAGWWEYDSISPVHFINVSRTYVKNLEKEMEKEGMEPFRTDLSVMLPSSMNIDGTMEEIEKNLGYQREDPDVENYVNYGVNWGYTSTQAESELDPGMVIAMAAFLILVIFTGYLIIYNIFQISVTGDIRYYGLLKTIGVTPRQLKRIIRQQALLLCAIGCPLGLAAGWAVGYLLVPVVIEKSSLGEISARVSSSPVIFIVSALFAVVTVLLSCGRPGRMAAKVSPVEAVKYTESGNFSRRQRRSRRAGIGRMALANLGRNKKKTVLVVVSLSLSVALLAVTFQFTGGFSMEKYLAEKTCADFIVGSTDYFRFRGGRPDSGISEETVKTIQANTEMESGGQAWAVSGEDPKVWMSEEQFRENAYGASGEMIRQELSYRERRGEKIEASLQVEGMDNALLEKLTVLAGDIKPLQDPEAKAIAVTVDTDDYGNPESGDVAPQPGEKLTVTYVDEGYYEDSRTGEPVTDATPEEYIRYHIEKSHDVEYTICAVVTVPYQISFRYELMYSMEAVMGTEQLRKDSGTELESLLYMFDTPDREAEKAAETFLAGMTAGETSGLMYESKDLVRKDFQGFQQMFLLLGGALCAIVSIVGILNFFNAILTGILARKREFAMLQAVGMTGKQLKKMLMEEGLIYAGTTILISLVLILAMEPLTGRMLESMFWFFEYHFSVTAVFVTAPVFLFLGVALPLAVYRSIAKLTIVERLRETE